MPSSLAISGVRFTPAPLRDRSRGLRGYVSIDLADSVRLDGITLRRTLDGRPTLSFPEHRDGDQAYAIIRPLNAAARREIEECVFAELKRRGYEP